MRAGDRTQGARGASGARPAGSAGRRPRLPAAVAVVLALALLTAGGVRPGLARQDEATPVGEAEEQVGTDRSPYAQVIAQGLAFFEPDVTWVWRVREVAPPPEEEAGSAAAIAYSFLWQRTGVTIVRNEETVRRVRIEPGEATYLSAGLTFTRFSIEETPRSRAWIIELVPADSDPTELEGEVIFTSQDLNTVPAGTWDLELVRGVLAPGEEADVPAHAGPALILPTFGTIQVVDADGQEASVDVGDGRLTLERPTLRNPGERPAAYLVAMIGERVLEPGETPEPEEEEAAPEGTPEATPEPGPEDDPDEDGLTNAEEEELGTDPTDPDTDGDGLVDGQEVQLGCDPTLVDSDEDGLDDADEVDLETDCSLIDSDGDGYVDGEEVGVYFTDPNDPESHP